MDTPLVSVVITTYNREKLLSRAIDSVIMQDYENIEIIISDDCSEFDVRSLIALKQIETHIPIRYRRNNLNSGACYTRNEGIKISNGFFVTGLDDDDEFTFDRISYLVNNYDPKYSFVASNTKVITNKKHFPLFTVKKNKVISYQNSLWENIIGTQVLTEKYRFIECCGFDVTLTSAQDADMWVRLIKHYGPALRLKEKKYILHTEHEEGRVSTSSKKLTGLESFQKKHFSDMTDSQKKYSQFKLLFWQNNHTFNCNMLKKLDFNIMIFILKKKFRLI
ncbi:glycosyltransferase [Shewanella sp.]|uniref:glycosyltransferase n=1 Tax=Shewanella sp. TaxID=50422 RepID=UPI001ECCFA9E|nr:glycosyltransferase [Shewanella sp.]NRB25029.1 glycosyltransferase [Shewanella sp.]